MNPSTHVVSPLRQRMIEDMRLRKLNGKTQIAYVRAVRRLAGFLGRSPDTATGEDLRRFQLHMVDQGTSSMTINATISGLRFFFEITLDRGELMAMMSPVREPRKLPVVLSREEVARLIAAARNPKHRAALSVAYGAGLRASEVISLKVGDIDSERMTLRVEQGKGRKDRYAMLSPVLLARLRAWWRVAHTEGKMIGAGHVQNLCRLFFCRDHLLSGVHKQILPLAQLPQFPLFCVGTARRRAIATAPAQSETAHG
jgi:integrase/recombinase XerD